MISKTKRGRLNPWTYFIASVPWIVIVGFSGMAHAHKVNIFAWIEGDMIYTESKFSGGRRAQQAPVEVYDENGEMILKGKTNDQGEFTFKIPKRTSLRIVLRAGMGHQAEWTIQADEIQEVSDKSSEEMSLPQSEQNQRTDAAKAIASKTIDLLALQTAFEKALDKKLAPILKMLSEIKEEKFSAHDIFSGIGYVFGLTGLILYFRCRQ